MLFVVLKQETKQKLNTITELQESDQQKNKINLVLNSVAIDL